MRKYLLLLVVVILLCQKSLAQPPLVSPLRKIYGVSASDPNNFSQAAAISADGRYVAFFSTASNLVPDDNNNDGDYFVYDAIDDTLERVSVTSAGDEVSGTSDAQPPAISADGRFVAFASNATTLVAGDTNGLPDIFLRDRQDGTTVRVSTASDGTQANDYSRRPSISADGRYIAWESLASNLAAGDTNNVADIFIKDTTTGITSHVSMSKLGARGNQPSKDAVVSADGRYVAFASQATNLLLAGTQLAGNRYRVYRKDLQTGDVILVSVLNNGAEVSGNFAETPAMSADARFIAFVGTNSASSPGSLWLRDTLTHQTTLLSDFALRPSLDASGRYIVYTTNLPVIPQDQNTAQDVYLYDTAAAVHSLISRSTGGGAGGAPSRFGVVAGDASAIAFASLATDLVAPPDTGTEDIFVSFLPLTPVLNLPAASAALTTKTAALTWYAPGAVSYEVSLSHAMGQWTLFTTERAFTTTPLLETTYTWQVRAYAVSGAATTWTSPRQFTITSLAAAVPGPPVLASASSLSWGAVSWATFYEVQVDTVNTFTSPDFAAVVAAPQTSVQLTGLNPQAYFWRVRARRPDNTWGAWSAPLRFVMTQP